MSPKITLRWKLEPKETGLRAIGASPRSSWLSCDGKRYACVSSLGGGWHGPVRGWYWVAGWDSDIPHMNTCNNPCATVEEAKEQAMAYVKHNLSTPTT